MDLLEALNILNDMMDMKKLGESTCSRRNNKSLNEHDEDDWEYDDRYEPDDSDIDEYLRDCQPEDCNDAVDEYYEEQMNYVFDHQDEYSSTLPEGTKLVSWEFLDNPNFDNSKVSFERPIKVKVIYNGEEKEFEEDEFIYDRRDYFYGVGFHKGYPETRWEPAEPAYYDSAEYGTDFADYDRKGIAQVIAYLLTGEKQDWA